MTGNRLRTLRFVTGLSQRAFARKIGVSGTVICRWEALKDEQLHFSPKYYHAMAEVLGCDPSEFIPKGEVDNQLLHDVAAESKTPIATKNTTKVVGGTAVIAGRDARNVTNHSGFYLSEDEMSLIELIRDYGGTKIIHKFIKMMLEIKSMVD